MVLRIDKTAPVIQFTGNRTYSIEETVNVGCAAVNDLSGLAEDPCSVPLAEGAAYNMEPGSHSLELTADDVAGNSSTSTITFEINVTYEGMCALVREFNAQNPGIGKALCSNLLLAQEAEKRGNDKVKTSMLYVFKKQVQVFSGKKMTEEHAEILTKLTAYL